MSGNTKRMLEQLKARGVVTAADLAKADRNQRQAAKRVKAAIETGQRAKRKKA